MQKQSDSAIARPLLAPRSVAIVGASDDPSKTTARPQQFLHRPDMRGRPISSIRGGRRCRG